MKKTILLLLFTVFTIGAFAQKGAFEVGGKFIYSTDQPSIGFGILGRYNFTSNWRGEIGADFFPKKDGVQVLQGNANVNYLFNLNPQFTLYPYGGLSVVDVNYDVDGDNHDDTYLGINFGGGVQYHLTSNIRLNAEAGAQYLDNDIRGLFSVGISYAF